jgi:spermidine/putrescine transport system substrate-binding protein
MKIVYFFLCAGVAWLAAYAIRQEFRAVRTAEAKPEPADVAERTPLRVLVRQGYFSPEFTAEAEERLGVSFVVTAYASDEQCRQLLETDQSWDLLLIPEQLALRLDRLNRTSDIDYEHIPNHRNMVLGLPMPEEMTALLRCSVPLFYTALGIGYNADYVGSIPLSWNALFAAESAAKLRGSLGVFNDGRYSLGLALISLGYSPNTRDPAEIQRAATRVKTALAQIALIDRSKESAHGGSSFLGDALVRRKVVLTMISSAAISRAMEGNSDLRFSCPNEGTLLCIDCLAIPRNTAQHALAEACINYLLEPRVSARLTNDSGFATTNEAATGYFSARLYHGPAFAAPTGRQFYYLQDVGDAEAHYRTAWLDLMEYYRREIAPRLDHEVGFERQFIESNDAKN